MALRKVRIVGTGLCQLKSTFTSTEGSTVTETESWNGPYGQLRTKQLSVIATAKSTSLTPTDGGEGLLTITWEVSVPTGGGGSAVISTVEEILWRELRKPVESNKCFAALTEAMIQNVKRSIEARETYCPEDDPLAAKLWDMLARGTTEFTIAVPVIRRTTTRRSGDLTGGKAWYRDTPPISASGTWEYLKTLDERRKEGKTFSQTEEWTGAETWDEDLYPAA